MELNEFIDKYNDVTVTFGENNEDPEFDYEARFVVNDGGTDKKNRYISISYKRDDEFTLDQLFDEVLNKFDEYFQNVGKEGYDSDFVYEDR